MKNKCNKFESYFTFKSEEEFLAHINECPDCREEYEKMQKLSSLIAQVKPHYIKTATIKLRLKAACVLLLLFACTTTLGVVTLNPDVSDTLKYGTTLTAEDYGFPVDSYGLISVE